MFEQELNAYWKTVVDTIKDGIMIVDKYGTIISVNKGVEKISGYTRDELIGSRCSILNCNICKAALTTDGDHWCILFKTGQLNMRRCAIMKKDNTRVHILKNASLLYDRKGNLMGAVETVTDITELVEKDSQIEAYRRELRSEDGFHGILGASAPMQRVFNLIANAARSDAPVIIFGESGVGKELVAKAIHTVGNNNTQPYIKVNCAALNESLLESELFGHVKGAFTGAHKTRVGRFEAARGGDIFLDEIGDLPLATQVKLLRVLEDKVIERVGDNKPIHTNVRIISATNRDLMKLVEQGVFRQDLFYRINVIPIHIPPLRERTDDIPILADFFFRRIQLKSGKKIRCIGNQAMRLLMEHAWPGNVRELKSAFEFAFVTCQGKTLLPEHFPPTLLPRQKFFKKKPKTAINKDETKKRQLIEMLEKTGGNQSETARLLGVSRVTVWNRMKKYNVAATFIAFEK
jgi:PAS domain S-box-containing protein